MTNDISDETLKRYQQPYKKFNRFGVRSGVLPSRLTPAELFSIPLWRWAALIKAFATNNKTHARHAYAALLLFPTMHQLRFEPSLKSIKKLWNASVPKYSSFYDCRLLLSTLMSTDFSVSEEMLRLRAIVTMRILSLFRGIDLARTTRYSALSRLLCQFLAERTSCTPEVSSAPAAAGFSLPATGP